MEGQFVCDIPAVTCNKSWCEILFKQIIRYESNDGSFKFNKQDDVILEKSKIKLKLSVPGIKCLGFLYITVCPHDIERSIVCQAWNWMHPRQSFSCVSCLGFFLHKPTKHKKMCWLRIKHFDTLKIKHGRRKHLYLRPNCVSFRPTDILLDPRAED